MVRPQAAHGLLGRYCLLPLNMAETITTEAFLRKCRGLGSPVETHPFRAAARVRSTRGRYTCAFAGTRRNRTRGARRIRLSDQDLPMNAPLRASPYPATPPVHPDEVSNLPREEALRRRYGPEAALPPMPASPIVDTLLRHRSVRAFSDQFLPDGTLEMLVAAGQSAASSSNVQAWSVIAVRDPARKVRLSVLAGNQEHIRRCPLLLLWVADLARLDRIAASRDIEPHGTRYLEMLLVGVIDAALAAQNAVLAAESIGLGTVYLGAMRNEPEQVAAEVGLPDDAMIAFGLCVGFEDPSAPTADIKPRLPQRAVLHHEQYSAQSEPADVSAYDQTIAGFQASQGMRAADWSLQTARRVHELRGRERLSEALRALGLGMR